MVNQTPDPRTADLRLYLDTRAQGLAGILHGAVGTNGHWVPGKGGKLRYVFGNDDGKDWTPFHEAWPADADKIVAHMLAEADKGGDVYCAAELMHADQLTVSSAVEMRSAHADVDHALDLGLVRAIGAYAIGSGTPGHGHVFLDFDTRFFVVEQYREICRALGRYLGGADSKIVPNDMLRPVGTYNHKSGKPEPVAWLVKPGPPVPLTSVFGPPLKMDPVAFSGLGSSSTGPSSHSAAGNNPDAEQFDIDAHSRVKAAIGKRSGDLSDDIYGVVAECFDAQLTPGNARFAIDSDPVLKARLGRGDIPRIWAKKQAKAAAQPQ